MYSASAIEEALMRCEAAMAVNVAELSDVATTSTNQQRPTAQRARHASKPYAGHGRSPDDRIDIANVEPRQHKEGGESLGGN